MCANLPMYYADKNEIHVDILGVGGFFPPFFHACPLKGGGALCVQMDFMRTFEANAKCNNINQV